jgi:hypothetical protein
LKRRVDRIFLPWSLWIGIFAVKIMIVDRYHGADLRSANGIFVAAVKSLDYLLTSTMFWFVPQLLLSLAVLILLRRHLDNLWTGASFLTVSLAWGCNIYLRWLPTSHMTAYFGYTFYLWLGYYFSKHMEGLNSWLRRIPNWLVPAFALATLLASLYEGLLIQHFVLFGDSLNTLRLTNQLYSISVILLLYRVASPMWPDFVNVRSDTFGLYLIQMHSFFFTNSAVSRLNPRAISLLSHSPVGELFLWTLVASVAYLISLGATKFLLSLSVLRWTVGGTSNRRNVAVRCISSAKD